MTEKRLIVDENYNLVDTVTGEWLDDTQVFDLANKLHEENKRLKSINQDNCDYIGDFEDDFIRLAEENKKLKRENDILIKQRLGEERLKQEIADYHTSNGRLHQLNNCLIRRLDEFHIDYSDILREFK